MDQKHFLIRSESNFQSYFTKFNYSQDHWLSSNPTSKVYSTYNDLWAFLKSYQLLSIDPKFISISFQAIHISPSVPLLIWNLSHSLWKFSLRSSLMFFNFILTIISNHFQVKRYIFINQDSILLISFVHYAYWQFFVQLIF